MMSSYNRKIGKQVEVTANGTTYRGVLKGMTATEIFLKSPTKTWQIPMDRVRSIKLFGTSSSVPHSTDQSSKVETFDLSEVTEVKEPGTKS